METIAIVIGFLLTNVLWMIFYHISLPETSSKRIVVKKVVPTIKIKSKGKEKGENLEDIMKDMVDLTEAPIADVRKSVLQ